MENNTNLELTPMERFGKFLAENLKPEALEELLKKDAKEHPEENNPLDLLVKLPIAGMLHDVTRLVVVNWSKDASLEKGDFGRIIDKWNCKVRLMLQDEGKTLKVFYE